MSLVAVWMALVLLVARVSAHPDGGGACFEDEADMATFVANHGTADIAEGIYSLGVAKSYTPTCPVKINVCGGSSTYKGVLIYAQSSAGRVGTFSSLPSGMKLMTCPSGSDRTVTHASNLPKQSTTVTWNAPQPGAGEITVYALVVKDHSSGWIRLSQKMTEGHYHGECPANEPVCSAEGATVEEEEMDHSAHGGGHSSVFNLDWQDLTVVFKDWKLNNRAGYVGTLIIMVLLGVFLEFLQVLQKHMDARFVNECCEKAMCSYQQAPKSVSSSTSSSSGSGGSLALPSHLPYGVTSAKSTDDDEELGNCCDVQVDESGKIVPREEGVPPVECLPNQFSWRQQLIRSALHMARFFLSFFLMMVFMILEVGLVCAIVGGVGLGFFLFSRQYHVNDPFVAKSASCH